MAADRSRDERLPRRAVVQALLAGRGELLVVAGLGAPAWDAAAAGDHPLTFPLWGGMGGAAMVGLGLALAQPSRRVLVLTGDGEMLMGLGALATIGVARPANLAVVVLDNERYGETGMQETHTAAGVDLAAVAAACGLREAATVRTMAEVGRLRERVHADAGPLFAAVKVAPGKPPLVLPPRDGAHLKNRFREALLGTQAYCQT
ncbi:MAG: thiamine pyrophosphate-dependent enzyme [Burkholderiales bacterium]|nr:thiamine pyrophosphate-dependent enzyme [Burkholderiales bacterium]